MSTRRPDPFALLFGALAADRFPAIREELVAAGRHPRDRDAFLLAREATTLLQSLTPDEGLGEGVAALAALVFAAFLFWQDGERLVPVDERRLARLLAAPTAAPALPPPRAESVYVQLPPLRVWGVPVAGAPPEPLDGWFAAGEREALSVVAIFGLFPGREGVTVTDVRGAAPGPLAREDGSPLFAPALPGGAAAGLASVVGEAELLELAWRVDRDGP